MRNGNVPALDASYWAAILAASLLGTTFGDFLSNSLGLGFAGALLPLVVVLGAIFIAERWSPGSNTGYYWAAIVVTRTGATNLGDFLSRTLHAGNGAVSAVVALLLACFLLLSRRRTSDDVPPRPCAGKRLPKTDVRYWAAIVMASTLGTTMGDFVSADLGFGLARGALLLGVVLVLVLAVEIRSRRGSEARYWVVIVVIRTTGTVMGGFLSSDDGLNLGFAVAACVAGALLLAALVVPAFARRRNSRIS